MNLAGSRLLVENMTFKVVFEKYFPVLCFFTQQFVGEKVCEDLVQDVFLRLWNARVTFESEQAMRVYLYVAAKNACIDYSKKEKTTTKYKDRLSNSLELKETNFLNELIKEEVYHILDEAIDSLPTKSKEVMSYTNKGYSNREIAEKLEVSINTIKTHKRVAFKKLRLWFEEQFPGVSTEDILYLLIVLFPSFLE